MTRQPPLYETVKHDLKRRIDSGEFKSGDLIPGEEALAAQFDCSRLTVHRALRELAAEGVVERKRRVGTRVAPRGRGGVLVDIPRIRDEISRLGLTYRYELIARRTGRPPARVTAALNLEQSQKALHVQCRHWAGRRVFQLEDRWINLQVVPQALARGFEHTDANTWLLDNVPYSRVDHEISAVAASKSKAGLLQVRPGTPLLRLERVTFFQGAGVTCATLLHPGPLYTIRSESA